MDLLPYLTGKQEGKPHETLYWRFGEQRAIRHGDWKLVVANGGSGKPELYDLAHDIGEQKDLASTQPDKVEELQRLYDTWDAEQAAPLAAKEAPGHQEGRRQEGRQEGRPQGRQEGRQGEGGRVIGPFRRPSELTAPRGPSREESPR